MTKLQQEFLNWYQVEKEKGAASIRFIPQRVWFSGESNEIYSFLEELKLIERSVAENRIKQIKSISCSLIENKEAK